MPEAPSASRKSILIIAGKFDEGFYGALAIPGEESEICSPQGALSAVARWRPEMIVFDAGSDVGGGLKLLRKVKDRCLTVPIIFLSDKDAEDLAGKALLAGARLYLKRPASIIELQESINALLKLKRASREKRAAFVAGGNGGAGARDALETFTTDKPAGIIRSLNYIKENISSAMTLDHLAVAAHMSKYHFCRLFKTHTEMSPMEFVAYLRIDKAKTLLVRQDVTVAMVAAETGYRDLSTFIRQFKKFMGLTPRDYKASFKKVMSS